MTDIASSGSGADLDIGRVIRMTYGTLRRAPWRLIAIQLVMVIANFLFGYALRVYLMSSKSHLETAMFVSGVSLLLLMIRLLIRTVVQNASIFFAAQLVGGETARIGTALGVGLRRLFPVLGVALLSGLAILAGLLLLVAPGVFLAVAFAVAAPAAVLERRGPIGSLKRSVALTRNNRWRVLAAGLLTFLPFVAVAVIAIILLPSMSNILMSYGRTGVYAYTLAAVLFSVVWGAAGGVFLAVLFTELRRLAEGIPGAAAVAGVFD